jgi:xylan 1,4-beta-xylosidase
MTLTHFRIDENHSNAYTAWQRMGSPAAPSPEQQAKLERAGKLEMLERPRRLQPAGGRTSLALTLPRRAVSLILLTWSR